MTFGIFCWISFVDINNECVTNDDDIKLTGKMVTFTPLMSAHNISGKKERNKVWMKESKRERQERERESNK